MRLRNSHARCVVALAVLLLLVPPALAQEAPAGEPRPITRADVSRALEQVRADPNLSPSRTIRFLRWTSSPDERGTSRWLEWIAGLFRWIAETGRVLVWVAAALLAALLAVRLIRLLREPSTNPDADGFVAPTHVRDLDIRPESLPRHVGAAARELWDRGQHRPALALLYRGLLSRLAHVHRVPVRDSTTEGDCLALAAAHLSADRYGFTARLVRAWQHGVYGGRLADTATVHGICADFAAALDEPDRDPAVDLRPVPAGGHS